MSAAANQSVKKENQKGGEKKMCWAGLKDKFSTCGGL